MLQLAIVGSAALITVGLTRGASIPALGVGYVVAYLVWFVLGYLMYAMALAAVAVLVSRPEEVADATAPVTVALVCSYLLMFVGLSDPTNPLIVVLSILPPCSPILMSLRIAYGVAPLWQVLVAMALTVSRHRRPDLGRRPHVRELGNAVWGARAVPRCALRKALDLTDACLRKHRGVGIDPLEGLAPAVGFEPTTKRLTAARSTTELRRSE